MNSEIVSFINAEMDKRFEGIHAMVEGMINEYLVVIGKSAINSKKMHDPHAVTIHLNNFCQENYNYLLIPYLSSMIKSCSDMNAILQKVITDLYFNPDHKANHIIFIPMNSYKAMTVYMDGGWKNFDLGTTLTKIVRRGNDVLQHYIIGSEQEDEDKFKKEVGHKKYGLLKDFTNNIDNMDDDEEFRDKRSESVV